MCSKISNRFFDLFDTKSHATPLAPERFKRSGQQNRAMRSFKDNITATIDFHGDNVASALERIHHHLTSHPHNHICLLIHGKGLNSGSILKKAILDFITHHPRCYGYLPAPRDRGGSGATLVRFATSH